jgi:hypothetical protein
VAGAVIIAIGIGAAGWLVGRGLASFRTGERSVVVKGVSEREVQADLAVWPLRMVVADDDLIRAHEKMQWTVQQVRAFLTRHGIDPAGAQVQSFSVTDARADRFRADTGVGSRYVINQTLLVRSTDPPKIRAASEKIGELVAAGVVLTSGSEYRAGGPTYIFTKLNAVKPSMIAEATARAREAAAQFARDSRSRLGGIRRASQGTFEILPRDQAPDISEDSQIAKAVRVVSTVEYQLVR